MDFRKVYRAILLLFLFLASSGTLSAQPSLSLGPTSFNVRGWTVGANTNAGGCLAVASYTGDTTLWIGFDKSSEALIAFTNPNWKSIQPGAKYAIEARTRGQGLWRGSFTGMMRRDEFGIYLYGVKLRFLDDFARAGGLDLYVDGVKITSLNLRGSSAAIDAIDQCQKAWVAQNGGAAGSGTQAGAKPDSSRQAPSKSSSGTGFFVSKTGHVLTNQHVIDGCTAIQVRLVGEEIRTATLLASDKTNDLALLTTGLTPQALPAFNTRARVGESVYVFGFPLSGLLASSGNFTTGNVTALAGMADDSRMFQISAPVQPGNSGGPVQDQSGNVTGVVVSKLNALRVAKVTDDVPQNINFIIKASIATNFMESNGLSPITERQTTIYSPADIAEQAKKFTVRVTCQ